MEPTTIKVNTDDLVLFDINSESNISIQEELLADNSLKIGHNIAHNIEEGKIKVELSIKIENENKIDFASFEISCFFLIENSSNYLIEIEDQKNFHIQLLITLISISYSTARGIIYQKLQDTDFNNIILPIVSPIKLISDQN